ncbi:MAG TPA: hypothetical protein VE981_22540, partial [Planctomycetota bacterium]|nr:hypothetical protein [Planctomycetota bacterium]
GIGADPALAGGFLLPPLLRASLDGMLTPIAKQLVYASLNGPALRQEVEAELRRQGTPQEPEIVKAYNEAIDRKIEEQEAALRRCVEPLNAVKWGAFEAKAGEKGITLKAAAELR